MCYPLVVTGSRSIAAAQTVPRRGDVDANVEEHVRLVHVAAEERARVVIGPRLHIGAFLVSPDRSIELYTKHHLGAFAADASPHGVAPPAESTVFQPGDRNPLLRFDGHTAAVAICADTSQPSHARRAANRGAGSYLASTFVIPSDFERVIGRLEGYAAQHCMAVVFSNFGGPSGGLASGGGSAIWSAEGRLLTRLGEAGSGVAIATEGAGGWRARTVVLGDA